MYYAHHCSYCRKLFYTWSNRRQDAARILYEGIKEHLNYYNEDEKEFEFDEHPSIEIDQMYDQMSEYEDKPVGGYEIR